MRSDPRGDVDGSPRRLWIEFEPFRPPGVVEGRTCGFVLIGTPLPQQLGVTGLDAADCWKLAGESLREAQLRPIRTIVWDIDVSSLDVWPALVGNPAARGVWYPITPDPAG